MSNLLKTLLACAVCAGALYAEPSASSEQLEIGRAIEFKISTTIGRQYVIESSGDMLDWRMLSEFGFINGSGGIDREFLSLDDSSSVAQFFRLNEFCKPTQLIGLEIDGEVRLAGDPTTTQDSNFDLTGTALGEDRFGEAQGALIFDNETSNGTDRARLNLATSFEDKDYSVSVWFRLESEGFGSQSWTLILRKGIFNPFGIYYERNTNSLRGQIYTELNGFGNTVVSADNSVALQQWHHAVLCYETASNGTMKFYLDGERIGRITNVGTPVDMRSPIDLGTGNYSGILSVFEGAVDDLRIFSHSLSDAEVLFLSGNR